MTSFLYVNIKTVQIQISVKSFRIASYMYTNTRMIILLQAIVILFIIIVCGGLSMKGKHNHLIKNVTLTQPNPHREINMLS